MSEAPVNPSPESQSLWYYANASNEPVGPLPFAELERLAAAGVIQSETQVIEKDATVWKRFDSIAPPPVCAETEPASAGIPFSCAAVPAKENVADGATNHGKNAEEFFQNCGRRLRAFAVMATDKSKRSRKKNENFSDPKEAIRGGAVLVLLVIAIILWHYWRPLLYLAGFLGTWVAVALLGQSARKSKLLSIGGGFVMACIALVLAIKSTSAGNNAGVASKEPKPKLVAAVNSETDNTKRPPAPETRSDGSPSDEIIRKYFRGNFKRGSTMVSTGGRVPADTLLFPVRNDPAGYEVQHYYFFRDPFGDWKCMMQDERGRVEIYGR